MSQKIPITFTIFVEHGTVDDIPLILKPMKTREPHYVIIQFLMIGKRQLRSRAHK